MREVCAECAQKCRSVHRKMKNTSDVPSSFFKVMIGSDFSRVLYLPPKFGPTASALAHKEAIIEDSSGQQWKVIVSIVNKSFAFQEGWNVFSLEHRLEVGNFLVFNYIGESHFVVKIYDKSGCEKINFPKKQNQKKRSRSRMNIVARDDTLNRRGSYTELDLEKTKNQHEVVDLDGTENNKENTSANNNCDRRAQSLYKDSQNEDPYYMTNRDFGDKEREDRSPMLDVFSYEISNNYGVDGTGKSTTRNDIVDASVYNKDPLLEEILGREATQDLSEFELTGRSHFLEQIDKDACACDGHSHGEEIPKHLLITYNVQLEENRQNNSVMSDCDIQKCQFSEVLENDLAVMSKERHPLHTGNCQNSQQMKNESLDAPSYHEEMERMLNKELLDVTPHVCSYNDQYLSSDFLFSDDAGFPGVVLEDRTQSFQTIIQDHGRILNEEKAEPFDYGAAHKAAFISRTTNIDGENSGVTSASTEKTKTEPLS